MDNNIYPYSNVVFGPAVIVCAGSARGQVQSCLNFVLDSSPGLLRERQRSCEEKGDLKNTDNSM
jgi:hypothetical protein